MRIALACGTNGWGGSEKVALALAEGFLRRGHAVILFCKAGSPLHDRAAGRFVIAPVLGGADFSPLAIARSVRHLRRFRPEAILANSVKDPRSIGVAARLLGIPFVYRKEVDEPIPPGPYHRLIHEILAGPIVVASEATRRTLLGSASWMERKPIHIIPNGIDPEPFAAAEPASLQGIGSGCVFGFVGRFEERKGVFDLADAWRHVVAQRPEDRLVMVGWGDAEDEFRRRLADVPGVIWLGPRDDIPELMRRFDVLVAPSHYEGFGLVLVEAMAAGRPVITTRTSSMPEILGDDEAERMVPPRDPAALADAMLRLAAEPETRSLIGGRNLRRVRERYSLDRMIGEHERLLQSVSTEASGSRR